MNRDEIDKIASEAANKALNIKPECLKPFITELRSGLATGSGLTIGKAAENLVECECGKRKHESIWAVDEKGNLKAKGEPISVAEMEWMKKNPDEKRHPLTGHLNPHSKEGQPALKPSTISVNITEFNDVLKRVSKAEPGYEPIIFESIILPRLAEAKAAAADCDIFECFLRFHSISDEIAVAESAAKNMLYKQPISTRDGQALEDKIIRAAVKVRIAAMEEVVDAFASNCEIKAK